METVKEWLTDTTKARKKYNSLKSDSNKIGFEDWLIKNNYKYTIVSLHYFKTSQIFKGKNIQETVKIYSGIIGDCGYKFELNKSYLVYSIKPSNKYKSYFTTSICMPNKPIEKAGEEIKKLSITHR